MIGAAVVGGAASLTMGRMGFPIALQSNPRGPSAARGAAPRSRRTAGTLDGESAVPEAGDARVCLHLRVHERRGKPTAEEAEHLIDGLLSVVGHGAIAVTGGVRREQ